MENMIIEVGIMKGQSESLFLVQGYGGCMDCTEFFEILNKEGKSIYIEYSDKAKVYLRRGNYDAIHGKYGISIQKLRKRAYTKKETFSKI